MPTICVFCGAKKGDVPQFEFFARQFGQEMASRGWGLVYGGAKIGMMGAVAGAVLDGGGHVKGIIPELLDWPEARWDRVKDMEVVPDLTVRKSRMMQASDAFVALPGGLGTLDEIFELAAARQLKMDGVRDKPLYVLNVAGYFDPVWEMVKNVVRRGFTSQVDARRAIRFVKTVDDLVTALEETFALG